VMPQGHLQHPLGQVQGRKGQHQGPANQTI
jgi:hypothetical protein